MITASQLEEILESQSSITKSKNTGIKRELFDKIGEVEGFASIITGIRRCGKSTLMLQILEDQNSNALFLNFEDIRLSGFEIADFNTLLFIIEKGAYTKLFLMKSSLFKTGNLWSEPALIKTCKSPLRAQTQPC